MIDCNECEVNRGHHSCYKVIYHECVVARNQILSHSPLSSPLHWNPHLRAGLVLGQALSTLDPTFPFMQLA